MEPVSIEKAKQYLRIDDDDQDDDIVRFVRAARAHVEKMSGTRLITQTVELRAGSFDDLTHLPIGPVRSITSIEYLDAAGVSHVLDPSEYFLDGAELSWAIVPAGAFPSVRQKAHPVRLTIVVGYGDSADDLPQDVLYAVLATIRGMSDRVAVDIDAWLGNHRIWL